MDDKKKQPLSYLLPDDRKKKLKINDFILICIGVSLALSIVYHLLHHRK